jgi:hypothetical protein
MYMTGYAELLAYSRRCRMYSCALALLARAVVAAFLAVGCGGTRPVVDSAAPFKLVETGREYRGTMDRSVRHLFPCIDNTRPVLPVKDFYWGYAASPDGILIECYHNMGIHRGALDVPGLVRIELSLEEGYREGEWWGDVGQLTGRGGDAFLVALGRGLVVALEGELIQGVAAEFRDGATVSIGDGTIRANWEGNSFCFDATMEADGEWSDSNGRWEWHGEVPARRFAALLVGPHDRKVTYPDLKSLLAADVQASVDRARRWVQAGPAFSWNGSTFPVLSQLWIEHRLAMFEAAWKVQHRWEGVGRGYGPRWYGHWDLVQNLLDRVWGDQERTQGEIDNLEAFFLEDEGRFFCAMRFDPPRHGATAPPPLLPQAALQVFYRDGDRDRLARAFALFERDFDWWWRTRRHESVGLFWWLHMLESGYDNIGRGQTTVEARHAEFNEYGAIDLSAMLALYAEDLSKIARILANEAAAAKYEARRLEIVTGIQQCLWDPEEKFFGDLHVPSNRLETVLSCASFWPLVAGAATDDQAAAVVEHIGNPREFWTPFPLCTVAADRPGFDLDCWRGPVWVSQNYWVIRGLRRYRYLDEAAQLALSTIEGMQRVWDRDRKIYEFYHPFEFFPDTLTRKGKETGPVVYYTGHNPLHAIILEGLWGLEPCRRGCRWNPSEVLLKTPAAVSFCWGDERVELRSDGRGELRCGGRRVAPGEYLPLAE